MILSVLELSIFSMLYDYVTCDCDILWPPCNGCHIFVIYDVILFKSKIIKNKNKREK